MRWDDRTFYGKRDKWHWIVSRDQIDNLHRLVIREHIGCRLWIATFDSGSIKPNNDEIAFGWRLVGDAMVSPPITPQLDIPCDQYDEWYLFRDADDGNLNFEAFDRFVNYGGFNLADPREMAESFDLTWERDGLDWLYPIQERFWMQIDSLAPISYIGTGDNDVLVTQRDSLFDEVRRLLQSTWPNRALNESERSRGS